MNMDHVNKQGYQVATGKYKYNQKEGWYMMYYVEACYQGCGGGHTYPLLVLLWQSLTEIGQCWIPDQTVGQL